MASIARARLHLRFSPRLLGREREIYETLRVIEKEWTSFGTPHGKRLELQVTSINSIITQNHAIFCESTKRSLSTTATHHQPLTYACQKNVRVRQTTENVEYNSLAGMGHAAQAAMCEWMRCMQTRADAVNNHPWTRSKLAERAAVLRDRRKAKKVGRARYKEPQDNSPILGATHSTSDTSSLPQTPLPSQPLKGVLQPRSPEEAKVAPLLARTDLVVTRNIEWANVLIGFEQENRYVIMDPRQTLAVVGYIIETSHWLFRQFLRSRRSFNAAIMDAAGTVLFTVRRPVWLINSTIYAEIDGKVVGFVRRRWHVWRRIYDLYLGKRQFAVVVNPGFWNWTFILKDENGRVLAEIDRHFRGFGYEMLTDAGQYAIRFGDVAPDYEPGPISHTLTAEKVHPSQLQGINAKSESPNEVFTVVQPLNLLERAVTLALAISLDNDYFSRHIGGWFLPIPFLGGEE